MGAYIQGTMEEGSPGALMESELYCKEGAGGRELIEDQAEDDELLNDSGNERLSEAVGS